MVLSLAGPADAGAAPAMTIGVSDRMPVPGQKITIFVTGCESTSYYRLYVRGMKIRSGRANKAGNVARGYTLPYGVKLGPMNIKATCLNDTGGSSAETAIIQVIVENQLGRPGVRRMRGQRIVANGSGCSPGTVVRVWAQNQHKRTLKADGMGNFSAAFRIQFGAPFGKFRIYAVCAQDYPPGTKQILEWFIRIVRG